MSVSEKLGLTSIIGQFTDHGWLRAMLFAWLVTPIGFYVVALVFEKRLAPIWRNSFKSFVLGDVALGVTFSMSVKIAEGMPDERNAWYGSNWNVFLCVGLAVGVYVIGHFIIDAGNYTKSQFRSPSKLYHDWVLFLGYTWLLARVGLPALFNANYGERWVWLLLGSFGFWIAMLIYDGTRPVNQQLVMRAMAHPVQGKWMIWNRGGWCNDNRRLNSYEKRRLTSSMKHRLEK